MLEEILSSLPEPLSELKIYLEDDIEVQNHQAINEILSQLFAKLDNFKRKLEEKSKLEIIDVLAELSQKTFSDEVEFLTDWFCEEIIKNDFDLTELILLQDPSATRFRENSNPDWIGHVRSSLINERVGLDVVDHSEARVEKANYILFSMVTSIPELSKLLTKFPSYQDQKKTIGKESFTRARASTVAWSGIDGSNVPIIPWGNLMLGFVIDPNKVDVPYGDIVAAASCDVVLNGSHLGTKESDTKYPGKKIVIRPWGARSRVLTNQAVILKHTESDGSKSYEIFEEGNVEIFAENIRRKYLTKGLARTNEALCLQRQDCDNPIAGIFLNVSRFLARDNSSKNLDALIEIMQQRSDLKLYIYDIRQKDHIVRVVENADAIALIAGERFFEKEYVATLPPYQGFAKTTQFETPRSIIRKVKNNSGVEQLEKKHYEQDFVKDDYLNNGR